MDPILDSEDNRRDHLLADRALQGLSPSEREELLGLGGQDDESWELAAAAADVGLWREEHLEPLPEELHSRIRDAYARSAAGTPPLPEPRAGSRLFAWSGWLAAAAAILIFTPLVLRPQKPEFKPGTSAAPSDLELWDRIAAISPKVALQATDHPLAEGASGELVWDGSQQKGFLKISNLAAVDPKKGTYQLWIFDKDRDERYPVDGGTFTLEGKQPPSLVPIQAKLKVAEPTLFAITLEPPGGVVVSDRQRIMLTATWSAGNATPR